MCVWLVYSLIQLLHRSLMTVSLDNMKKYICLESQTAAAYGMNKERSAAENLQ